MNTTTDRTPITDLVQTGYGGVLPSGEIVDRREHPEASPIPSNPSMGVPAPVLIEPTEEDLRTTVRTLDALAESMQGHDTKEARIALLVAALGSEMITTLMEGPAETEPIADDTTTVEVSGFEGKRIKVAGLLPDDKAYLECRLVCRTGETPSRDSIRISFAQLGNRIADAFDNAAVVVDEDLVGDSDLP